MMSLQDVSRKPIPATVAARGPALLQRALSLSGKLSSALWGLSEAERNQRMAETMAERERANAAVTLALLELDAVMPLEDGL